MPTLKIFSTLLVAAFFISACHTSGSLSSDYRMQGVTTDTLILQSLFADRNATISEENVQRILDGNFKMPQRLRMAVVRLENSQQQRRSFWGDEDYLKTQQAYLDSFTRILQQSPRVASVALVPDLLVSKSPSFTQIREAALRLQADAVLVYAISSDLYANYKVFGKNDLKAFATTQLILLDVRTGLIPFSTVVTKDVLSQKRKEEMSEAEARHRIQTEAVSLTIADIGMALTSFLQKQ